MSQLLFYFFTKSIHQEKQGMTKEPEQKVSHISTLLI